MQIALLIQWSVYSSEGVGSLGFGVRPMDVTSKTFDFEPLEQEETRS